MHRLDAGAEHLGDVGGVGEHQRDDAEHERARRAAPGSRSAGHAEADEVAARSAAAGRGRRRCRARPANRSGKNTGPCSVRSEGDERGEDQDEHLGDHHDLQVDPQRAQQAGQAVPADAEVEEAVADARPAAAVDRPATTRRPATTAVLTSAITIDAARAAAPVGVALAAAARDGCQPSASVTVGYFSTGAPAAPCQPLLLQRAERAVRRAARRPPAVTHDVSELPLSSTRPNCSGLPVHRQLADDRSRRAAAPTVM